MDFRALFALHGGIFASRNAKSGSMRVRWQVPELMAFANSDDCNDREN
jgi:hypothetical protein